MKNFIVCGHSAIGKSHENSGIKCQDSCDYINDDNIVVSAIADGVSSSKHSDVASKTAVKIVVDFCFKNINKHDSIDTIISVIKRGFDEALFKIKQIAGDYPADYDTTLTVAVLINETLYYGQIGDSGIIAFLQNGKFIRVTEAQNGEGVGKDKPVYPLAAKQKWSFGKFGSKIKAIFLATDGVLKHIQPPLLEKQQYSLNHNYLRYVYGNIELKKNSDDATQWVQNEVEKMPPEEVDYDDKTLSVVINKKANLKPQPREYYDFPSSELWRMFKKRYEEKLYPSRMSENHKSTENGDMHRIENIDCNTETEKTISEKSTTDNRLQSFKPILIHKKEKDGAVNFLFGVLVAFIFLVGIVLILLIITLLKS